MILKKDMITNGEIIKYLIKSVKYDTKSVTHTYNKIIFLL